MQLRLLFCIDSAAAVFFCDCSGVTFSIPVSSRRHETFMCGTVAMPSFVPASTNTEAKRRKDVACERAMLSRRCTRARGHDAGLGSSPAHPVRNTDLSLSELAFHLEEDVEDGRCDNAHSHELSWTTVPRTSAAIVEGQGEQVPSAQEQGVMQIRSTLKPDTKILRDPDYCPSSDPTGSSIAQLFSDRTAGPAGSTPTSAPRLTGIEPNSLPSVPLCSNYI